MSEPTNDESLLGHAIDLLTARYEAQRDFNEYLDSEEPVCIGPSVYPRSKVLYWVDPEAYETDKVTWESEANEAKHEEAMLLLRGNTCTSQFEDLLLAVERGRVIPFIGAGLSKPLGMPLWSEALTQLLGRLPGADTLTIQALIDAGQYLEAAQQLAGHDHVQTSHFIRTTYRAQKLRLKSGPLQYLPRFAKGCVVTTNFDDAIEKTYEAATHQGKPLDFKAYMHGTQEHNFFSRLVRGDRCILKLPGDAENDATHILTAEQYEHAYCHPFD
ncbi:MAG: SIR2 family protein, partial [Nitrospira sp.]|nr:SIR2 family protein [Nitrospira sp.]